MGIFNSMDISASGMSAQRLRSDIITQNMANVSTTRGADGQPYRRKTVIMQEKESSGFRGILNKSMQTYGSGVKVTEIVEDKSDFKQVYDPSHPDANSDGYVSYPNVDTITEMTNMIDASRAFEANVTAFNALKSMYLKGLELGK